MRAGSSEVALELDRGSVVPIYRQIYERLREGILAGALPEGTRLPPERSFAERLAVNRSTVVHAYRDLAADGLIEQKVGSGSRVASLDAGGRPDRASGVPWWVTLPPWRVGEFPAVLGELAASGHRDSIAFVQGVPPAEPSPLDDLTRSFARAGGDLNLVLTYGDSEGYAPLREAIATRMRARGCTVDARDVLVLTGSTQGITLVAQSLAEPGDEIVVEAPTYPGALQIFQIAGLRAIPVPVDDDGMRTDHVEAILRTRRPRFIYTMPAIHNPTGVTMSAGAARSAGDARQAPRRSGRRRRPVRRARGACGDAAARPRCGVRHLRILVLEDDRPVAAARLAGRAAHDLRAPAAAQAVDRHGVVDVHPSRRARLPRARLRRAPRRAAHRAGAAAARSPSRRSTGIGRRRCASRRGGDGYYLWATAPRDMRARALLANAERRGASFLFGEAFFAQSGGDHNFRLALTPVARGAIEEGIRRIGEAAGDRPSSAQALT